MGFLSNIFGNKNDTRNTNKLIFELAEYNNRKSDIQELYRRFPSMEIFAKVVQADFSLQNGAKHVVCQGENLGCQSVTLPGGQRLAQFFADKSDPRLRPNFVGMNSREAFEMILKMD